MFVNADSRRESGRRRLPSHRQARQILFPRHAIPHGRLETIEHDSKTVGTRRKMNVYTPPDYSSANRYPVFYLLHGIGGDETEWPCYAYTN